MGTTLVWKRARAVERDLMRALELDRSSLCRELGSLSCVDDVHLAPLGGNEPFVKVQYTSIAEPAAVTPMVMDRIVLGACAARVAADAEATPKVFTRVPLGDDSRPADGTFLAALDAQHTDLFRRLLSRDPSAQELETLHALAVDDAGAPVAGRDLATLGCYVIGTHLEFVFL